MPSSRTNRSTPLIKRWRHFPRLSLAVLAGLGAGVVGKLLLSFSLSASLVLGWDVCAAIYLLLSVHFVMGATHDEVMQRANEEEAGNAVVVSIAIAASALSLISILTLLGASGVAADTDQLWKVLLPVITILNSWAFIHVVFAFHYAHAYYAVDDHAVSPSLEFPGKAQPGYSDFLYFSFIVGTSGQTADVNVATSAFRRTVLFHCVLSYLFNAAVLSLMINVVAGQIR